ncbi:DHA2 family efflux MFS transporter permease subunit [Methylovirgula sp. 4M-Z18]|nr:DHA2 family efflux MFS transporter permease subunit [Methylovirgula sp. 4M-Z18]
MEFYTSDSMNLILPDIAGTLGLSTDEASWILTVYSGALFLGVPVSIWMAGHFGYKRFLLASIVVFAAASIGCALAPDLPTLLFWRAIQGFAGGSLYVWWRASIYLLLSKPQRSPSLMRVSMILYLSSAIGLLASGYITDNLNWRLIFLPNLVLAAGAIWLLSRFFPNVGRGPEHYAKTDYLGIGLLAAALISLQIILSRGPIDDWFGSSLIQFLAWIGSVAFFLFVLWQASPSNPAPLLHIDLLRDRNVVSSALIGVCTGVILSGSLYALPEYLRNVDPEPHGATRTGQIMCIYALTAFLIRPAVPEMVARFGQRKTIIFALTMLIASMLLLSRLLTTGTPDIFYAAPLILYAFCLSPLLPSVGSGTVARIEQNKLLDGVSLYMTFRQFGAAIGVALVTIFLERRETLHSSRLFDHLRQTSAITQDWLRATASIISSRDGYSHLMGQDAANHLLKEAGARQAATLAYADAFLFMAVVGALALCIVPIIPPTPATKK